MLDSSSLCMLVITLLLLLLLLLLLVCLNYIQVLDDGIIQVCVCVKIHYGVCVFWKSLSSKSLFGCKCISPVSHIKAVVESICTCTQGYFHHQNARINSFARLCIRHMFAYTYKNKLYSGLKRLLTLQLCVCVCA